MFVEMDWAVDAWNQFDRTQSKRAVAIRLQPSLEGRWRRQQASTSTVGRLATVGLEASSDDQGRTQLLVWCNQQFHFWALPHQLWASA